MRGFFGNKTASTTNHIMGKADKKKINAIITDALDLKQEYKLFCMNNRTKVIKHNNSALYFLYFDKIFPTIQNFNKNLYKCVFLDDGAVGPLTRGADVMAPGILKHQEMCPEFSKNEILGVEIIGKGLIAVGMSLLSSEEMKKVREGPVVDIFHLKGDSLDDGKI